MSERAKIHLGDIQCECLKRSMDCEKGGVVCDYRPICHAIKNEMPLVWDLRDPPRFNEAQMAFWKPWYEMGFIRASVLASGALLIKALNAPDILIHKCAQLRGKLSMKIGDSLDLAELCGKDGAE